MAADNENRLISKAIQLRDISYLLERGVEDSWFWTEENKTIWNFLHDHWNKYSEVPTAVTVKDNFPNYRLLDVKDSVNYLLDQLVEYNNRQKVIDTLESANNAIKLDGDHNEAVAIVSTGIANLIQVGSFKTHDINLVEDPMNRFDSYQNIKTRPNGLIGMATGFSTIDLATGGFQPGQLITIVAAPKTGKSVIAMQTAINIHEDGFVPMFQSFEMSNEEQQRRHDSMRAHIAHSRLSRGGLNPDEEKDYKAMLTRMEGMHRFLLTDSVTSATLSTLSLKVEKWKPDVLFVDGVYLMEDEQASRGEARRGTPQNLTRITQGMKNLAQKYGLCIVQTTQVLPSKITKGRVTSDAIGWSSSFVQDSDVVLVLQRQDEEDDTSRILRIDKSRNSGPAETELLWDWENGRFEEYGNPIGSI